MRLIAVLLLILQVGILAHRLEHYLAPQHMECGEQLCDAFAPSPDAPAVIDFASIMVGLVFFLRFWSVRHSHADQRHAAIGFRAHAPPARSQDAR